jgi:hypothetical protein
MMRIRITVDRDYAPEELEEQAPFEAVLMRQLPGPDRPDYWIAKLAKPIRWLKGDDKASVNYLILTARWEGTRIGRGMVEMPINIAYVVDETVLSDTVLAFEKCEYVAIGSGDEIPDAA